MDKIYIRDLLLRCIIGIYPEEREKLQDVLLNIEMSCASHAKAASSDDIIDTVNYKTITKKIIKIVESSDYQLIETMAEKVAEICLEDKRVYDVRVCIDKPGALRFAKSVAVEVFRTQESS